MDLAATRYKVGAAKVEADEGVAAKSSDHQSYTCHRSLLITLLHTFPRCIQLELKGAVGTPGMGKYRSLTHRGPHPFCFIVDFVI